MITKITGEQPFQVLTNNFSISPSSEGYTLQISADGTNFSNLFTVGAGVTRLVTGVAANSYYRLSGNQSKVSINWMKTCVTEGGAAGNELTPVTEFPLNADPGTVVALASGDTYGIYQYDGENWNEAGADVDLSAYWTSAQTQSAITAVEDHLFDFEEVTSSALTELHEGLLEVSGRSISTEEIELPIAAAVNDIKGNIEVRLDQQYYKKAEVDNIAARKMNIEQVDVHIENYVNPTIAEVNDNIENKELATSAALNDLCQKISEISGGSGGDMSAYWTSAQTEEAISAATSGKADAANITANHFRKFPTWNEQGIITGTTGNTFKEDRFYVNNGSFIIPHATRDETPPHFYAPVSAGTAGDILVSTGNGAPVWTTDNKVSSASVSTIWKGTQAEYDAITTKDPSTFYIIVNN